MEVTVPTTLNVLNGSDARLSCTFNSCYTVNHKQFSLNWTYQECNNCSEEMVSPGKEAGWGRRQNEAHLSHLLPLLQTRSPEDPGVLSAPGGIGRRCVITPGWPWRRGEAKIWGWQRSGCDGLSSKEKGGWEEAHPAVLAAPCSCRASCPSPLPQFLQFRMKIINLKLERFRDRVEFSGNPSKYDVSVTLRNVQLEDEGTYNCYIMNPPDRHRGHGKIYLQVLMEGEGLLGGPGCSHPAAPQQG